jgi:dGTPase
MRLGKPLEAKRKHRQSHYLNGKLITSKIQDEQHEPGDVRLWGQRDRDRILYSDALSRLAGITQVVGSTETHAFHNRLTHTLKVAQVARRIAERLLMGLEKSGLSNEKALTLVNPDVAEAAALAHDIGHPPFGHVAEDKLHELVYAEDSHRNPQGNKDGFEGNAQTFRILTRLSPHRVTRNGLDLTRATLNAVLKYPWLRQHDLRLEEPKSPKRKRFEKFGAYETDKAAFDFARAYMPLGSDVRSIEATVMDYADDVAYCVHDLIDFYKFGVSSLAFILTDLHEFQQFYKTETYPKLAEKKLTPLDDKKLKSLAMLFSLKPYYEGDLDGANKLQALVSQLISMLMEGLSCKKDDSTGLYVFYKPNDNLVYIELFKDLIKNLVINTPQIFTQQMGQKKIIEALYKFFHEAIDEKSNVGIPPKFHRAWGELKKDGFSSAERSRLACDIVSGLSEAQAFQIFGKITGVAPGSIRDLVNGFE